MNLSLYSLQLIFESFWHFFHAIFRPYVNTSPSKEDKQSAQKIFNLNCKEYKNRLLHTVTITLLATIFFSFSKDGDELESLDRLIILTEEQLSAQKKLRDLMAQYRDQQEIFYKNQSREEATKMVEMADTILKLVEEGQYRDNVPPFYLQELKLFASLARKGGLKKP